MDQKTCPVCGEEFELEDPEDDETFCEMCILEAEMDAMHYGG